MPGDPDHAPDRHGTENGPENQLLEQKAYIDIHTGLPNKGSCEELLNNREILREPTACVIFDLNNLKPSTIRGVIRLVTN